jgi:glycerol-3-phosphate cytidylyltransferase-like family protein
MSKPAWTKTVQDGAWIIVSRSATVMAAEGPTNFLDDETKQKVLAAVRYAEHHWSPAGWKDKHLSQEGGDDSE